MKNPLPKVALVWLCLVLGCVGGGQKNGKTGNVPTATPAAQSVSSTPAPSSTPASEPPSGVTMANYQRLKTRMTYAEVVQILGKEGTELSSNEIGGTQTVMYQWEGEGFGANMNAMFQNGRLIQKAQFGLK